jgi:hypothetical protein
MKLVYLTQHKETQDIGTKMNIEHPHDFIDITNPEALARAEKEKKRFLSLLGDEANELESYTVEQRASWVKKKLEEALDEHRKQHKQGTKNADT